MQVPMAHNFARALWVLVLGSKVSKAFSRLLVSVDGCRLIEEVKRGRKASELWSSPLGKGYCDTFFSYGRCIYPFVDQLTLLGLSVQCVVWYPQPLPDSFTSPLAIPGSTQGIRILGVLFEVVRGISTYIFTCSIWGLNLWSIWFQNASEQMYRRSTAHLGNGSTLTI